jgi:hypothetical protein
MASLTWLNDVKYLMAWRQSFNYANGIFSLRKYRKYLSGMQEKSMFVNSLIQLHDLVENKLWNKFTCLHILISFKLFYAII